MSQPYVGVRVVVEASYGVLKLTAHRDFPEITDAKVVGDAARELAEKLVKIAESIDAE